MPQTLREWIRMRAEMAGISVTSLDVQYWRGQRHHVHHRVELHDWLQGDWPQMAHLFIGEEGAQELRDYVQSLVAAASDSKTGSE